MRTLYVYSLRGRTTRRRRPNTINEFLRFHFHVIFPEEFNDVWKWEFRSSELRRWVPGRFPALRRTAGPSPSGTEERKRNLWSRRKYSASKSQGSTNRTTPHHIPSDPILCEHLEPRNSCSATNTDHKKVPVFGSLLFMLSPAATRRTEARVYVTCLSRAALRVVRLRRIFSDANPTCKQMHCKCSLAASITVVGF